MRAISEEVSTLRLYLLRVAYLVTLVLVGANAWPALIQHTGPWGGMAGVAWSLYAAMSVLAALGIRYPIRMMPLLFLQLLYKVVWLVAVAIPTWPALRAGAVPMAAAVVMDLVVIPWPYAFDHYVRAGGDRWRRRSRSTSPEKPTADVSST